MTYKVCKRLIQNGNFEKEDMAMKLDVFLLNDRITQENYNELVGLMDEK